MDLKRCAVCKKKFDFDKTGLEGPDRIFVCGEKCAETAAANRGNRVAIHDKTGKVVKTNVQPTDTIKGHRYWKDAEDAINN